MGAIDNLKESMTTLSGHIYKLGHEVVAKEAGITVRIVRAFCSSPESTKNSDIQKIRNAVKNLMPEDKEESK